jgi:hypothetical protein
MIHSLLPSFAFACPFLIRDSGFPFATTSPPLLGDLDCVASRTSNRIALRVRLSPSNAEASLYIDFSLIELGSVSTLGRPKPFTDTGRGIIKDERHSSKLTNED